MALLTFFLFSLILLSSQLHGLTPSRPYAHGPVPFDSTASLFYTLNLSNASISFALVVTDPAVISSDSGPFSRNWLGLGVSEPISGSMLGADIATVDFLPDGSCKLTDRHVPFFAFPLNEPGGSTGSIFPLEDDCQNDGSWTLISCEKAGGSILIELQRGLAAHDTQDRAIVKAEGRNAMIYAYGSFFGYHGSRRGAMDVDLFKTKGSVTKDELPSDVDGSVEILATNYTVPATKETIYACQSLRVDLTGVEKRMIVAAEPILHSTVIMVHHITLYLCSSEDYARKTRETIECTTSNNGIDGTVASPQSRCSTFVFGYAKGTTRFILPREAGIPVTSSRPFLIMEIHYDNPDALVGNVDSSGIRVYYTNKMRKYEAGSLVLADSFVSRIGQPVISGFKYMHTCPSECTSKFSQPINVYGSFLHMHTTGMTIYTNRFSKEEQFLGKLSSVNFWNDRFQKSRALPEPIILSPGQQLATTCVYDTSKRANTKFGLSTRDEMCIHFLQYYPVQRDPQNGQEINLCGFAKIPFLNLGGTLCGDNAQGIRNVVSFVRNPKFEDNIGSPTDFGDRVKSCERLVRRENTLQHAL